MKATSKIVTLILLIIFFVGLCVMLYPAISQYWNSKVQSRVVDDMNRLMDSMKKDDYTEYFVAAQEYNKQLNELPFALNDYKQLTNYFSTLNLTGNGVMGVINIDKIQVVLPIYHGTSSVVLSQGCGHLEGTSLPIGGESTHSVLSAHRGLPSATLFTHLDKLQVGDTFTLTILGEVLTYQVDQIKIVTPADVSQIQVVEGEDYCTLLTCTPYGINTHRLLVRGKRTETKLVKNYYITSEAYLIDRIIVTPFVALPILFVLIVYVIFKPVKKKIKIVDEEEEL